MVSSLRYDRGVTDSDEWDPRDADRQVSLSGSVPEVLHELEQLEARDQARANRRPMLIMVTIVGVLVVMFAAILLANTTLMLLIPPLLIGGIFMAYQARLRLDDRRIEIGRTLISTFKDELREGRPLELNLDFRAYWRLTDGQNWLTLKMTLENGVAAQLSARSNSKRKQKRKRKYTKTKDKIIEILSVRLCPPKGQALDAGLQVPVIDGAVGSLTLKQAKLAPRGATFVFATSPVLRVNIRGLWPALSTRSLLKGRDAVLALVTSYGLLGRAGSRAAASAG